MKREGGREGEGGKEGGREGKREGGYHNNASPFRSADMFMISYLF